MLFKRPRSTKLIATADLNLFSCAMAIVVFAVLASCMTTLGDHPAATSIELPRVAHSVAVGGLTWGANRHDAMIVAVTRNGLILMSNDLVLDQVVLTEQIKRSLSPRVERKLYIKADAQAPFSRVKAVLDAAKSLGIQDVCFLTAR